MAFSRIGRFLIRLSGLCDYRTGKILIRTMGETSGVTAGNKTIN